MTSSNDIINRAIVLVADNQQQVQGQFPNFDSTPAGVIGNAVYSEVVQTVGRKFGWDFSRNVAALVATGNAAPVGWSFEYAYPTNGIQVLQLLQAAIADANDPLPINWVVGNTLVGGIPTKVIWTNLAAGFATFSNQPPESLWDPLFTEEVVRLLAEYLAMGVAGRPDSAKRLLETAEGFGQIGETRQN